MKIVSIILCILGFVSSAAADPGGRPEEARRPERGRVVLYSGEHFEGVFVELLPGAEIANLGELRFSDGRKVKDRISSVRVFGGLKVRLFAENYFSGDELELGESVARLARIPRKGGNWDNCLSSVRVSGAVHESRGDRAERRGPGRDQGERRDGPLPRPHGGGDGTDVERMIVRVYRELLAREPNDSEIDRYREAVLVEGWGRAEVYADLRDTREYRAREADRMIVRAYRDLLDREPDPSGRERWRRKLLDQGWSEDKLRRELRKTDEYRRKEAREGGR